MLIRKTKDKKKYMVTGVNLNMEDCYWVRYPCRGMVEAPKWGKKFGGLPGIDWISFRSCISNEIYLIIEYTPKDGIKRFADRYIKIRKGTVVYHSAKISEIQTWLEDHGIQYRGYGARIRVGDKAKIKAGDYCDIVTGDNCLVKADSYCNIISGDNCKIKCRYGGFNIIAGHNSNIKAGINSTIRAGEKSSILTTIGSIVSCGKASLIKWKYVRFSNKIRITKEEAGIQYFGDLFDGKRIEIHRGEKQ